ncbi:MAG: UxaA family hydrolase [Candidatus Micrarchaeaceae archaeon]
MDNEKDNVAVALVDLPSGLKIKFDETVIILKEHVPFRMKFSIRRIKKGESVIKDGLPIGFALEDIAPGSIVHIHNLASERSREWKQ